MEYEANRKVSSKPTQNKSPQRVVLYYWMELFLQTIAQVAQTLFRLISLETDCNDIQ